MLAGGKTERLSVAGGQATSRAQEPGRRKGQAWFQVLQKEAVNVDQGERRQGTMLRESLAGSHKI